MEYQPHIPVCFHSYKKYLMRSVSVSVTFITTLSEAMASETVNSSVPVAPEVAGLDRTKINSSGEVQLVSLSPQTDSESSQNLSQQDDEQSSPTTSVSLDEKAPTSKRKRLLLKTKEKLHITKTDPDTTAPVLADARDTVSNERLGDKPPEPEKHNVKDLLHHPASTIQSKVTGHGGHQIASNLVAKEISHGTDVEVVRAQAEAEKPGTEAQGKERKYAVEVLMKERQDMFVRWTMDRHVTKVRILPVDTVPRRSKKDFKKVGEDGKERMDWEGWAHHVRSSRYEETMNKKN
jgi:hypothetical protein